MKAPQIFNNAQICHMRERYAAQMGEVDFLHQLAVDRLIERLDLIRRDFSHLIDVGAHNGFAAEALQGHEKVGTVLSLDPAPSCIAAASQYGEARMMDVERLPDDLPKTDAVISLLYLHQVNDVPGLIQQMARQLRPDGLFFAILCGGRTLQELRASMTQAEEEIMGGVSPHIAPMADIKDVGGLLQRAGLAMPVADSELLTVTYSSVFRLMSELKLMGEGNALQGRRSAFTRRDVMMRTAEIYAQKYGTEDGQIPASFELISLTGWSPDASQPKALRPGSAKSSMTDLF